MSTIHTADQSPQEIVIAPSLGRMSEDDFVTWALATRASAEWVDGEVITMSPSSTVDVDLSAWLTALLRVYVQERNLGQFLGPELMVRLAAQKTRRVPDLLFISTANLPRLQRTYLDGPPDLAIEIVSDDSQARDWRVKYLEYEAAGVGEYWIIDPSSQAIEASHLVDGRFVKISLQDGKLPSTAIAGFYLRPEWLWASPRPNLLAVLAELGVRSA